MTYEELLINIELNGYENVLPFVGKTCLNKKYWFIVCDEGDCHLFNRYGKEDDIGKVTEIYEDIIPKDIKNIVIPNTVMSIADWAFYDCSVLLSVMIPDSVMNIRSGAFYICSSLVNMTIPDSVKNIGAWAFEGCNGLTSITFKGKTFAQIKSMENYPFGIKNESIIKCN